ncbi:hypothetical protein MUP79_07250, partial [Candidatus Bathyarchaeota archaeon]|nr:hypothetical protein [Candidatus Bathyarchaeota archaeon]
MPKKIVNLMIVCVCLSLFPNLVSASLIDSENFEGYTAYSFGSGGLRDWQTYYDLLVNQSGGRWNCTTASQYPTCLQCHDCYSGTYGGYAVYPSVDDSSQFLYIWSLNGTYSSFLERYYSTSLRFNHTNGMNASLYGSNFTWITKFKFRLMNYGYGAIFNDSHPLPLKSYYGFRPVDTGLLSYAGSATTWVRPRGGDIPLNYPATSGNYYDYPSWRAFFPMNIGTQGTGGDQMVNAGTINEPRYNASQNCRVSDGEWHIFELYQYFNSTRHIRDVEIYLDGGLCSDGFLGTGSQQLGIFYKQDYIDFETSAIFGIGIDDIRIYDNYTATDGIPTCMDGLDNDND